MRATNHHLFRRPYRHVETAMVALGWVLLLTSVSPQFAIGQTLVVLHTSTGSADGGDVVPPFINQFTPGGLGVRPGSTGANASAVMDWRIVLLRRKESISDVSASSPIDPLVYCW